MSQTARPQARAGAIKTGWLVPAGLLLLGMLPVIAGALRLEQLSGMSDAMPANPRFGAVPLPVVLHIVSATILATLGQPQFAAGFRRRWPAWHRVAGRLLVTCGLLVALTGLSMTLFYTPPDATGALLFVSRIVFGSAMVVSIVVGLVAILRRNIKQGPPCLDGARLRNWPRRRTASHGSPTAAARAIALNMRALLVDGFRRRSGTAESRGGLPPPTPRGAALSASLLVGG
jgi:hypothetical protein